MTVLPELVNLLLELGDNLRLEGRRQSKVFDENPRESFHIPVWLVFVPEEEVFELTLVQLDVELDWDQLQVWLTVAAGCKRASLAVVALLKQLLINL